MKTKVSLCLSDEIIREIDARRGLTKRSTFAEFVLVKGLEATRDVKQ